MIVIDEQDVGKSREQILLELIYESTGELIPLDKVTFGKPQEIDKRLDLETDPNTFIPAQVDPAYDNRYSASGSGFMYRRRSIVNHTDGCDFSHVKPTSLPFRITDILDQINECMPYPIHPADVVDYEYKTLEEVLQGVYLTAHPESLLWIKGTQMFVGVGFISGDPLIETTTLDGFNEWQEPAPV